MAYVLAVLHGIQKRFSDVQSLEAVVMCLRVLAYSVIFPAGNHMCRLDIYLVKSRCAKAIQHFSDRICPLSCLVQCVQHEF